MMHSNWKMNKKLKNFSVVKALLEKTANCEEANRFVNEEDENTNTCLHLAAYHGHADIAEVFLHCGADPDAM